MVSKTRCRKERGLFSYIVAVNTETHCESSFEMKILKGYYSDEEKFG